jgi:CRISPR system Cascade subunit CasC
VRLLSAEQNLLPPAARGVRTKKLLALLLTHELLKDRADAQPRIEIALAAAGLQLDDKGQTQYLLFLGQGEIDALAALIAAHWDDLAPPPPVEDGKKKSKKEAKAAAPDEVVKKAKRLLDGGKAVDVALFGRMLADMPAANQDAACQVAHALSTHRVEREFDYFTAVDDRGSPDETGAGMIGQVEFTSATFYRYAALDAHQLQANLQGDQELALAGLGAFTTAFARAIPSGKQNTFAAHNPPSFIGVVLRHASPLNLANAFERPVVPRHDQPLTALSVAALARHEQQLGAVYGSAGDRWAVLDLTGAWPQGQGEVLGSLDALNAWVQTAVQTELAGRQPGA